MRARRTVVAGVLVALGLARRADAKAPDIDLRAPLRGGFAYTGVTRGPALEFSWGAEFEVLRLTRHLSLYVMSDLDSLTRLDLPNEQVNSAFAGIGLGGGLFYLTDGGVGFGFDAVNYVTFDQKDFAGGGFGAHAYIYPFYQRASASAHHVGGLLVSYVESAISVWTCGRVDWSDVGRGGTLAFGVSIDIVRAVLLPYLDLLTGNWRR